jgi:hypothetical protein
MSSENNVMKYNEKQKLILEWIASGCEYYQGSMLYGQFGKNNFLRKDFPGKQHKYATKIIYELCKSVGLDYARLQSEKLIPALPNVNQESVPEQFLKNIDPNLPDGQMNRIDPTVINIPTPEPADEMPEILSATNIAEYPPIIRRIIAEYAETFQERSKTHRILTEMPQGNSQALKTKRAEIFDLVKSFTIRLEYLFKIRHQFEQNGEIPAEEDVWPKPKELPETTLSEDPEELRKMKKNQQTANTKDQNMLDFQTMVKGDEKKTMPSGPKRTRIENRIKGRLKFIQKIDLKLVSLNAN